VFNDEVYQFLDLMDISAIDNLNPYERKIKELKEFNFS